MDGHAQVVRRVAVEPVGRLDRAVRLQAAGPGLDPVLVDRAPASPRPAPRRRRRWPARTGAPPPPSGTRAPARASRAAATPAAAASPTWSDLPSEPNAARSPPARSSAMATASLAAAPRAAQRRPRRRPTRRRPRSDASRGRRARGDSPARARPSPRSPRRRRRARRRPSRRAPPPTTSAAGAVGALRWARPAGRCRRSRARGRRCPRAPRDRPSWRAARAARLVAPRGGAGKPVEQRSRVARVTLSSARRGTRPPPRPRRHARAPAAPARASEVTTRRLARIAGVRRRAPAMSSSAALRPRRRGETNIDFARFVDSNGRPSKTTVTGSSSLPQLVDQLLAWRPGGHATSRSGREPITFMPSTTQRVTTSRSSARSPPTAAGAPRGRRPARRVASRACR